MIVLMLTDSLNRENDMRDLLQEISKHDRGEWVYTMARFTEEGTYLLEGNIGVVIYANDNIYGMDMYDPIVDRREHMIIECYGCGGYYVTSDDYRDEYCDMEGVLHIMEDDFDLVTEYGKVELEV